MELEETVSKKRCQYAMTSRQRRNIERGLTEKNYPLSSWRPKGTLVAHLHEHQVNSLPWIFRNIREKPKFNLKTAQILLFQCILNTKSNCSRQYNFVILVPAVVLGI